MSHTPGPWTLQNGTVVGSDGIGVTRPIERFNGAVDANTRLIAAAPDLLAACNNAVKIIEQLIPEESARGVANVVLFQLRSAISNAEGGAK